MLLSLELPHWLLLKQTKTNKEFHSISFKIFRYRGDGSSITSEDYPYKKGSKVLIQISFAHSHQNHLHIAFLRSFCAISCPGDAHNTFIIISWSYSVLYNYGELFNFHVTYKEVYTFVCVIVPTQLQDHALGRHILWVRQTEGVGVVQPGDGKAPGRPDSSLPIPKGDIQKNWEGSLSESDGTKL